MNKGVETHMSLVCSEDPEGDLPAWDRSVWYSLPEVATSAQPREVKAGRTGCFQTQGAWETLCFKCYCALVSLGARGMVLSYLVKPRGGSRCGRETGSLWRPRWDKQGPFPLVAVNPRCLFPASALFPVLVGSSLSME